MAKLTIGADPEFPLYDKRVARYLSAHKYIPGTKQEPHKLNNGAVQLDGLAVEFNINPAADPNEFAANIKSVLKQVRTFVPRRFSFSFVPSVVFDKKYFDNEVPDACKELGCTPDFSAAEDGKVKPPPRAKNPTLRTFAGHIHIGFTKDADWENHIGDGHFYRCVHTTRLFDAYVNLYKGYWDRDRRRFQLYGAGGAFRPKSYGVECRSLSNAWLNHPELYPWLHGVACTVGEEWNYKTFQQTLLHPGATPAYKRAVLDTINPFPLYKKAA